MIREPYLKLLEVNKDLIRTVVDLQDFSHMFRDECTEFALCTFVKRIVKLYVTELTRAKSIHVKDKHQFRVQMKTLGLSIGFQNEDDGEIYPSGNVVVLPILLGTLVLAFLLR